MGAIGGGVLGALVLIALGIGAIMLLRRRRRRLLHDGPAPAFFAQRDLRGRRARFL